MLGVFVALAVMGHQPLSVMVAQEVQEGAHRASQSECGPPKSAMSDIKIDIKTVGRFSYEVTVWIEGTPMQFEYGVARVTRINSARGLGLNFIWARQQMTQGGYGHVMPPMLDNRYVMSGPNKVQANPAPLGFGY
jgi:hypothetical protein